MVTDPLLSWAGFADLVHFQQWTWSINQQSDDDFFKNVYSLSYFPALTSL